eukprot:TRINITY_DN3496_c0_g1_i1.p1 TRINITY_DN3496_c0_g1~~TRINITY_DN3496_c0_g1_i1.p1  ORF type:complete len:718 (+),score=121.92 TRINITY_DN3496_c0_g1_i1:23-2155(+)
MSAKEDHADLRKALDSSDLDKVKEIVRNSGCPEECRYEMWKMVLGVKEEGTLRTGDVDMNSLQMDTELLLQGKSDGNLSKKDVEDVLVDYCICRGTTYSIELTDLIGPLISLQGVTTVGCSGLLKAICSQYAPFLHYPTSSPIGEAATEATQVDTYNLLIRLLLQYHDAVLCTHLDRNKCDTGELVTWLNGIFVNQLGSESIHPLWDVFFSDPDQLLSTFFGLAVLVGNRTELLEASGEQAVTETLGAISIPSGVDSINSLLQSAAEFRKATPPSACMRILKLFNPIGSINQELHDELITCVVLPIESEELIEVFKKRQAPRSSLKFMVLDCRALKSYNFARLPTAVHVGPNVGYEPTKLSEMLERFEGARGSHFCLMGTGRGIQAELNLLNVLALRFVSNGFSHIGVAVDGFKGVIPFIKADLIEFVRETVDPQPPTPSKGLEDSTVIEGDAKPHSLASLKEVDTAALKKAANEKADKVKKWGRGLLEKWTSGAGAETSQQPAQKQEQSSRFGGYFGGKTSQKDVPSTASKKTASPKTVAAKPSNEQEPAFALVGHDSGDSDDDFQLISHPTRVEGGGPEEPAPVEAPVVAEEEKEIEEEKPEAKEEEPKKEREEVQEEVVAPEVKKEEKKAVDYDDDIFGDVTPEELASSKAAENTTEEKSASPSTASPKKDDMDIFADDFNIDDIELPSDKKVTKTSDKDDLDDLFN